MSDRAPITSKKTPFNTRLTKMPARVSIASIRKKKIKPPFKKSPNNYENLLNKLIKEAEKEEMKKKEKANIAQKNNKSSPSNENKRYEEWLKKEVEKYKKIINNEKGRTNRQGNTIMSIAPPLKNKRR